MSHINLATLRDNPGWSIDKVVDEVVRDCVLDLPLYKLPGAVSFLSRDLNRHVCTVVGAAPWTPMGKVFDGATGFITVPASPPLDNELAGTIEFWVLRRVTGAGGGIISRRSGGAWLDMRYTFDFAVDNPRFNIANGVSNLPLNFPGTITNGVWTHLVGTHNGSRMKGYINGALNTSIAQTITPEMTGFDLIVGRAPGLGNYLDGIIGELRIYNRALTDREIMAIYLATRGRYR